VKSLLYILNVKRHLCIALCLIIRLLSHQHHTSEHAFRLSLE
jgi:hypothetical protein